MLSKQSFDVTSNQAVNLVIAKNIIYTSNFLDYYNNNMAHSPDFDKLNLKPLKKINI